MRKYLYTIMLISCLFSSSFGQNETKNFLNSESRSAQSEKLIYVSGIIKDSINKPFVGVNVIIKNTRIGTIADKNGKYQIDISDFYREKSKIILMFSFVGYKTIEKEIDFSKKTNADDIIINITLKDEAEAILCNG